jgi:hypothetical protein
MTLLPVIHCVIRAIDTATAVALQQHPLPTESSTGSRQYRTDPETAELFELSSTIAVNGRSHFPKPHSQRLTTM